MYKYVSKLTCSYEIWQHEHMLRIKFRSTSREIPLDECYIAHSLIYKTWFGLDNGLAVQQAITWVYIDLIYVVIWRYRTH